MISSKIFQKKESGVSFVTLLRFAQNTFHSKNIKFLKNIVHNDYDHSLVFIPVQGTKSTKAFQGQSKFCANFLSKFRVNSVGHFRLNVPGLSLSRNYFIKYEQLNFQFLRFASIDYILHYDALNVLNLRQLQV